MTTKTAPPTPSPDDFSAPVTLLSPEQFENVVGGLLVREGFQILQAARPGVRGPDFEAVSPSGERVYVEVKHFRGPFPRAVVDRIAEDIERYRLQYPDARGLIVVSGDLLLHSRQAFERHPELKIWTGDDVRNRLASHPDVLLAAQATLAAQSTLQALAKPYVAPSPESAVYAARLAKIEPGRADWRAFETWCADILTDVFAPDLGPPERQNRTDDDLDIMDAIFPIRTCNPPWSQVRSEFSTRFVVGEFKNLVDPIGQKQVESIVQYLWAAGKRQFGVLVSRTAPSDSALALRRRAWLDQHKMVVFATAQELIEMLEVREGGGDPYDALDAQVEQFLRTLTP